MSNMRIVVLDGYTLNPGDLNWDALEELGSCVIYERTPPDAVIERLQGATVALTNKALLPASALEALPDLRYIGVLATGCNVVDVAAACRRGIVVTNVPAYSTASVAQIVFALLLELTHHVGDHAQGVRAGRWARSPDFCYWETPLIELAGQTMGLVGYGQIGQAVARIARAFGMEVIVYTRTPRPDGQTRSVALDELFAAADVVSLHCPLTPETRRLVNAGRIELMKPSAFLINTGRGPLVDESALAAALREERLAGAAVDVLSTEPPAPDNPLLAAPRCLVTPHLGWATRAARERLLATAVENLRAFSCGQPLNVVQG